MGDETPREIKLGYVSGAYGVRGWIKVFSHTHPRERIVDYGRWRLSRAEESGQRTCTEFEVEAGRLHGKAVVAKLAGIDDRDAAESLIGSEISVDRSALPACAEGEYYWADLEGLVVRNKAGEELGVVDHLLETGGHDVLVLAGDAQQMIPFAVPEIVLDVDLDGGTITVDWERSYWE